MSTTGSRSGGRVRVRTVPMWRVRLDHSLPRWLMGVLCCVGIAASARYAIAPPRRVVVTEAGRVAVPDRSAEAFAVLFARRYLTWNAQDPLANAQGLEPFAGGQVEASAGLLTPASGSQRVEWAEVVQAREPQLGTHVYTVAAQTDRTGLVYLAVAVERRSEGAVALAGYPAFVGAPASGPAISRRTGSIVQDGGLEVVVRRALSNYLAGASTELAADLAPGARVSVPTLGLRLVSLERLEWAPGSGSVQADVSASDAAGGRYTLGYEVEVLRRQGRWEVSAVETDPDA